MYKLCATPSHCYINTSLQSEVVHVCPRAANARRHSRRTVHSPRCLNVSTPHYTALYLLTTPLWLGQLISHETLNRNNANYCSKRLLHKTAIMDAQCGSSNTDIQVKLETYQSKTYLDLAGFRLFTQYNPTLCCISDYTKSSPGAVSVTGNTPGIHLTAVRYVHCHGIYMYTWHESRYLMHRRH